MLEINTQTSTIKFKRSWKLGVPGLQNSFTISTNDVLILGIKGAWVYDDEEAAIILVDRKARIYTLNVGWFGRQRLQEFLKLFGIENIPLLGPEDYDERTSYVLFPPPLKGKTLFDNHPPLYKRILNVLAKVLTIINPLSGVCTKDVVNYIQAGSTGSK